MPISQYVAGNGVPGRQQVKEAPRSPLPGNDAFTVGVGAGWTVVGLGLPMFRREEQVEVIRSREAGLVDNRRAHFAADRGLPNT